MFAIRMYEVSVTCPYCKRIYKRHIYKRPDLGQNWHFPCPFCGEINHTARGSYISTNTSSAAVNSENNCTMPFSIDSVENIEETYNAQMTLDGLFYGGKRKEE